MRKNAIIAAATFLFMNIPVQAQGLSATVIRVSQVREKQNSLAFWHQPHPVMPHIARKSNYKKLPGKSAQQKCHPAYPNICLPINVKDVNCSDIPHRRFKVLPPDPYRLDGDGDGIGCEK